MAHFIGLDLSLNSPGIIIIDSSKKIQLQKTLKQNQRLSTEQKLINIRDCIIEIVAKYTKEQLYAVIENFSPHASIYPMETGAAHYIPRTILYEHKIPMAIVHLKHLKMFATSKASATKEQMTTAAQTFHWTPASDDEADAFFLAHIGWHLIYNNFMDISRKQIEVLMRVKQDNPSFKLVCP